MGIGLAIGIATGNPALGILMDSAMSSSHRSSYTSRTSSSGRPSAPSKKVSRLRVNLAGTKVKKEVVEGWLKRLFQEDKVWEEETITQVKFLHQIHTVLSRLGYTNILFCDVNGNTVYEDRNNTPDDLDDAIRAALSAATKATFSITMQLDTTDDKEADLYVTMASSHEPGKFPLEIRAVRDTDPTEEIQKIAAEIEKVFKVEEYKIS